MSTRQSIDHEVYKVDDTPKPVLKLQIWQDHGMTPPDVDSVIEELREALKDSIASVAFAKTALTFFSSHIEELPRDIQKVFPKAYISDLFIRIDFTDDPDGPDSDTHTPASGWLRSEALEKLAVNGFVDHQLGQQWIVAFFAQWEEIFRPRLAKARGIAHADDIKVPLLGDLRRLRHYVVHNKAKVESNWPQKSTVLAKWFSPGDTVHLSGRHLREFEDLFPWTELRGP
ncbi:hypothetical protein [Nocardia sp. A7]|uniref:hypothetical protein n=1 Tax=Nocardia sp. A7 TaxID=2789274 RepID=UPI00397C51C0